MSTSVAVLPRETSLFPSETEWKMLKEQAGMLVKTGLLPMAIKTPEQAIAIALKGRELGIPMMQAFAHIHIIQGKPAISAELMLSLIFRNCPGAIVNYIQTSNERCEIEAKRPNGSAVRFVFSIDDAKRAELLSKGTWKSYPGAMLRARAIAIMARALFPDAIMGCSYTPEEMGAEVDEEGDVIEIPRTPASSEPPKADATPSQPSANPSRANEIPPSKSDSETAAANDRLSLCKRIVVLQEQIGLDQQVLKDWVRESTGKESLKNCTVADLTKVVGELEREWAGPSGAEEKPDESWKDERR